MRAPWRIPLLAAAVLLLGCSPRTYLVHRMADSVSGGGELFGADDDPDLVRDAVPFALKAEEYLLSQNPEHRGLLLSLCRGFTQYAVAFVWQDALETEDRGIAEAEKERARRLFLRAREYGIRGLSAAVPGFRERLAVNPRAAAASAGREEVPLLFWTSAAWSLAVASSPNDPSLLADLPRCEALMRRALELQETYDAGAIHEYFVAFEGGRPEAMGGSVERARRHYERARELAAEKRVSPMVTYAETVSVRTQNRAEFLDLLGRALSFDARSGPAEYRLANLVAQRKAKWLKGRVDELFLE